MSQKDMPVARETEAAAAAGGTGKDDLPHSNNTSSDRLVSPPEAIQLRLCVVVRRQTGLLLVEAGDGRGVRRHPPVERRRVPVGLPRRVLQELREVRDGVVPELDLGGQVRHPLVVARRHFTVVPPPDVEVALFLLGGELRPAAARAGRSRVGCAGGGAQARGEVAGREEEECGVRTKQD